MQHVSIEKYIPRLENGRYRGLILGGRPGVGKTHYAQSIFGSGAPLVRVPMATRTPEDFGSYPVPDHENKRIEQYLSEASIEPLLARNIGDQPGILLLDDVTLADPRVQSGILEIVQFGVIANESLGKNVMVVCTGNGIDDECNAAPWNKALLGRCLYVDFEPDFDFWLNLEEHQRLEPLVVAFLKDFPNFFAPAIGDEKASDEKGKTPSPRDWSALGFALNDLGGFKQFEPSMLFKSPMSYFKSFIGHKAGEALTGYARNYEVYPSGEEVFNEPALWKALEQDKKVSLSGGMSVAFAVRNHTIGLLKGLDGAKRPAKEGVLDKFWQATRTISEDNREVLGANFRYMVKWAGENDKTSMGIMADYFSKPEIQGDKELMDSLRLMWEFGKDGQVKTASNTKKAVASSGPSPA